VLAVALVCATLVPPQFAAAQTAPAIPPSLITPDKVETRAGTLDFKDGAPSKATLDKVYDDIDFSHAQRAFENTFQGVSLHAVRKGLQSVGVKDNEAIIFSELMDAKSLWLTTNADTIYSVGASISPKVLWCWRPHRAFSAPSRIIGLGGSSTLDCPVRIAAGVESTWSCPQAMRGRCRKASSTSRAPEPITSSGSPGRSSRTTTIPSRRQMPSASSPRYIPTKSRVGTSIAEFLTGKAPLGRISPQPPAVFHEASGKVMNTVPPNDFSYFELLNEIVQQEPAGSLDPELMGPIAAIGIVKGKPFAPDERMKKILTEAVAHANATTRSLFMNPRDPSWFYYPGSNWFNPLFVSGYKFETPIPMITKEGAKPFPPTGYRQRHARRWYFYGVTGITPAMAMRVTGIGSQYLFATLDAEKNYFDAPRPTR
jgi:hypothetical protein